MWEWDGFRHRQMDVPLRKYLSSVSHSNSHLSEPTPQSVSFSSCSFSQSFNAPVYLSFFPHLFFIYPYSTFSNRLPSVFAFSNGPSSSIFFPTLLLFPLSCLHLFLYIFYSLPSSTTSFPSYLISFPLCLYFLLSFKIIYLCHCTYYPDGLGGYCGRILWGAQVLSSIFFYVPVRVTACSSSC